MGLTRLPGATHDLTAARRHGIPTGLTKFGVACYAENPYRAAGPTIAVPYRRRPRALSANQKKVNRNHARNRAPGERAGATHDLTAARFCVISHRGRGFA